MKTMAAILSFGGMIALFVVASQNTSSAPARIAAPSWMRAHW
jgi:hypothetical protein